MIAITITFLSVLVLAFLCAFLIPVDKLRICRRRLNVVEPITKVIASIAVPFILAVFGYYIQMYVSDIQKQNNIDSIRAQEARDFMNHDLAILQEFQKAYYEDKTRPISLHYLKLLKDHKTEVELRKFAMYGAMKIIIKRDGTNLGQKYLFNVNNTDNFFLGTNLYDLFKLDKNAGIESFNWLIDYGPAAYKDYSSEKQYRLLISWLWKTYPNIRDNIPEKNLDKILLAFKQ